MTKQGVNELAARVGGADAPQRAVDDASYDGLRLVTVADFEPAVALSAAEEDAYRRRFGLLFADEDSARRGGIGRVVRAMNAQGESFALKTVALPPRDELVDQADYDKLVARLTTAFREEYECHRELSGVKGFPRLYGYGQVEGVPAIVMEWVEGETLARLRARLAVDDDGRLSPLMVAQLGRDLFELLQRLSLVGGGFAHRDVSPANIMVRTARLTLEQQIVDGVFDLCLIDFGSALELADDAGLAGGSGAARSFTERFATLRRATVAYAPPEMLSRDLPNLAQLRRSPKIDVYAAASVLYDLMAARPPFDVVAGTRVSADSDDATPQLASPYRIKVDTQPQAPRGAHGSGVSLADVLTREPQVALAAAEQAQQLGLNPDSDELRDALNFVDDQLGDIILASLPAQQEARPTAEEVRTALVAFCESYGANVGRSLRGEPLVSCSLGRAKPLGPRATRAIALGCAAALAVVVVFSAAVLADGARVALSVGSVARQGRLSGWAVAAALVVPAAAAFAVGWPGKRARRRFLRATTVLTVLQALALALVALLAYTQPAVGWGIVAAACAVYGLSLFALALRYAQAGSPAVPRRRLPASSTSDKTKRLASPGAKQTRSLHS